MLRVALLSSSVCAFAVAVACGRIDDENCLATRTCPSSAGQGGEAGAATEPLGGAAGLGLDASAGAPR